MAVLSAHTQPNYMKEQIRKAALWDDVMNEQLDDIHTTYNVKPLQCYTKNLTLSILLNSLHLPLKVDSLSKHCLFEHSSNLSSPIEESATFDFSGLLSFKTEAFGHIPSYLYPLHVLLYVVQRSENWKGANVVQWTKCSHIVHQLCLMPSVQKMKLSQLYKQELVEICKSLDVDRKERRMI